MKLEENIFSNLFPILDVRSPAEYHHAHIPGALSLPLFSDEERAIVGTAYKQESREQAIKLGLDFFGPKMRPMVEFVEDLMKGKDNKTVVVHCWRGGMRSDAVAWLLTLYGFSVHKLDGGYKAYRRWVLDQFNFPYQFLILGGYTGSGKTKLLYDLEKKGESIIDLEGIAIHKGSAFGHINLPDQPGQEMFENLLANELFKKRERLIWLEDESQRLGHVNIPEALWTTMRNGKVKFITIPFEVRLKNIVEEYGNLPRQALHDGILRIQKRLGGLDTKNALAFLAQEDIVSCFRILLHYYDKQYDKGLQKRQNWKDLLEEVSTIDALR